VLALRRSAQGDVGHWAATLLLGGVEVRACRRDGDAVVEYAAAPLTNILVLFIFYS
jgi:hypothetical protein